MSRPRSYRLGDAEIAVIRRHAAHLESLEPGAGTVGDSEALRDILHRFEALAQGSAPTQAAWDHGRREGKRTGYREFAEAINGVRRS